MNNMTTTHPQIAAIAVAIALATVALPACSSDPETSPAEPHDRAWSLASFVDGGGGRPDGLRAGSIDVPPAHLASETEACGAAVHVLPPQKPRGNDWC